MKKQLSIYGLIMILFTVSLVGCEKEAEDPASILVGTWNQLSTKIIFYYDNVKQSETNNTYEPGEMVTEINSDGTAQKYSNGIVSGAFYWDIDGDLFIITDNYGIVHKVQFSVDKSTLILKWASESSSDGHIIRSEYESLYDRSVDSI